MKTIDMNIGLTVGTGEHSYPLLLKDVFAHIRDRGFTLIELRVAASSTEPTLIVRVTTDIVSPSVAERVYRLAQNLNQDCIAYVEHDGDACLVGPGAHLWGGRFKPQHWISLA